MSRMKFLIACPLVVGIFSLTAHAASELEGSEWRLLNIASMDDSSQMPDDSNKYTLSLAANGAASMRADCNRGVGKWQSESPGQLGFGPIAATRALCPPDSISESYLAQFEYVRSYVLKEGHLFLATMADGAIIEFEPLPGVAAAVLGEDIHSADAAEVQDAILTRMFDHYAAENGIVVNDAELDAYVEALVNAMSPEEQKEVAEFNAQDAAALTAMRREMGSALIRQWKINGSLYKAYGGRIIYQQLGPEPLDAYYAYLQERQKAGDFSITNTAMEEQFWSYFTSEDKHEFMKPGTEDEANAFTVPPWKMKTPEN